eukprot:TRINITY_DN478_c0_g1_i1.p1 TRINITY_DN478_c0_g1~~TRINITY_DN478_c0_g1_i1.p1  ORF type:complete len:237 (-),score=50.66 TRINITY_DN478_c0_g1_i1:402-1112(-)
MDQDVAAIEDFMDRISTAEQMIEGIMLTTVIKPQKKNLLGKKKKSPHTNTDVSAGKIIFSLSDLPVGVKYVSDTNVSIKRINEAQVRVGGKNVMPVIPTPSLMLNNPPGQTRPGNRFMNIFTRPAIPGAPQSPVVSRMAQSPRSSPKADRKKKDSKTPEEPKPEPTFLNKALANIMGEEKPKDPPKSPKRERLRNLTPSLGRKINKARKATETQVRTTMTKFAFKSAVNSAISGLS